MSAGSTTSGRASPRALRGGRPATASGHTARWRRERTRTTYTPVRIFDGMWMRNRPATRPPWSSGFGSPSRDSAKLKSRSTGPTSKWATWPAATADSGPRSVKLLTVTPVPGRAALAVGVGSGASVMLPARSRTATVKA